MSTEVGMDNRVREAVRLLTELQEIDDDLRDIALERGDLPEEVERLKGVIRDFEVFIAEKNQLLDEAESAIIDRAMKHDEAKAKLAKFQQQLYAVKTSREYDAITAEFNYVKEEIAQGDTALAGLAQRKGELKRMVEDRKAELERVRHDEQSKSAELKEKLSETEEEERQLMQRRDGVVVQLLKPLYAHYERIRKAKDGRGVARILDGACGGCFAVIPPQTQVNIRKLTDIVLCETCGRIIVP